MSVRYIAVIDRIRAGARMLHATRPWTLYTTLVPITLLACLLLIGGWNKASLDAIGATNYAFMSGYLGGFCWAAAGSRLLPMQRALRKIRVPRELGNLRIALALLASITILLPATIIVYTAGPQYMALMLLLLLNFMGVIWALVPPLLAALVFPATLIFQPPHGNLWPLILRALALPMHITPQHLQNLMMLMLTSSAAFGALWLWRFWLSRDPAIYSRNVVPWVLSIGDQPGVDGMRNKRSLDKDMLSRRDLATEPSVRLRLAGGTQPVDALRALLGPPFLVNNSVWIRTAWVTLPALLLLAAARLNWNLVGLILALLCVVIALFRLLVSSMIESRINAYADFLTEPALLPGLGAPARQRRNLLRATLGWNLPRLVLVGLAYITGAALLGATPRILACMLGVVVVTSIVESATLLHVLARRNAPTPLVRAYGSLAWSGLLIWVSATVLWWMLLNPATPAFNHSLAATLVVGWALVALVLLARAVRDWRHFQHRPHPFLQC